MQVSGWRYKVTPIDRVINDCKRRADDAWWDGNDDEARLHEQEAKLHEEDRDERGYQWVPNFSTIMRRALGLLESRHLLVRLPRSELLVADTPRLRMLFIFNLQQVLQRRAPLLVLTYI